MKISFTPKFFRSLKTEKMKVTEKSMGSRALQPRNMGVRPAVEEQDAKDFPSSAGEVE